MEYITTFINNQLRQKTGGCHCPDCGESFQRPPDLRPCTCRNLALYVTPGEHVHIQCPRHGDVKVYGSHIHTM